MSNDDDLYSVLGVAPTATPEEIKSRYRYLSQAYHPDKFASAAHKSAAEEDFKRMGEAYHVLNDPSRRALFDESRSPSRRPRESRPIPPNSQSGYQPPPRYAAPRSSPPMGRAKTPPRARRFGRAAYFGWLFAIGIVLTVCSRIKGAEFLGGLIGLTWFIAAVLRLRDTGTAGWWCLLGFIPFANLVIIFGLLFIPRNAFHKRSATA